MSLQWNSFHRDIFGTEKREIKVGWDPDETSGNRTAENGVPHFKVKCLFCTYQLVFIFP